MPGVLGITESGIGTLGAKAGSYESLAIGPGANAVNYSLAIGPNVYTTEAHSIAIGSCNIANVRIGCWVLQQFMQDLQGQLDNLSSNLLSQLNPYTLACCGQCYYGWNSNVGSITLPVSGFYKLIAAGGGGGGGGGGDSESPYNTGAYGGAGIKCIACFYLPMGTTLCFFIGGGGFGGCYSCYGGSGGGGGGGTVVVLANCLDEPLLIAPGGGGGGGGSGLAFGGSGGGGGGVYGAGGGSGGSITVTGSGGGGSGYFIGGSGGTICNNGTDGGGCCGGGGSGGGGHDSGGYGGSAGNYLSEYANCIIYGGGYGGVGSKPNNTVSGYGGPGNGVGGAAGPGSTYNGTDGGSGWVELCF